MSLARVAICCRASVLKHLIVFVVFLLYNVMYNAIVHGYIPVFCIPALPCITGRGTYTNTYMGREKHI